MPSTSQLTKGPPGKQVDREIERRHGPCVLQRALSSILKRLFAPEYTDESVDVSNGIDGEVSSGTGAIYTGAPFVPKNKIGISHEQSSIIGYHGHRLPRY